MQICYFNIKTSQSKAFSVPNKGVVHMDFGPAHLADTSTVLQMFLHLKTKISEVPSLKQILISLLSLLSFLQWTEAKNFNVCIQNFENEIMWWRIKFPHHDLKCGPQLLKILALETKHVQIPIQVDATQLIRWESLT